jgi:hypothetical protein
MSADFKPLKLDPSVVDLESPALESPLAQDSLGSEVSNDALPSDNGIADAGIEAILASDTYGDEADASSDDILSYLSATGDGV